MRRGEEVRIGLVLYGGVSLAVYIYGVVLEVQRLLVAAKRLQGGEGPTGEHSAYAQALTTAGTGGVTVDLLSGTSAGGINGVLLAKSLSRGGDVGAAREIWIEGGDIEQLLQPPSAIKPSSLLQSEDFEAKLAAGLERLGEPDQGAAERPSILDLFVSGTNIRGGRRLFRDDLRSRIPTKQHRYVFQLKLRSRRPQADGGELGYDTDHFGDDARLIRLARATSAFPFAFEPVGLSDEDATLAGQEEGGWFADGGILNNKPFTEAVETIVSRASDRPVDRWLFSVDPDPERASTEQSPGPKPAFDQVVVRAIAAIPRYQSISRDLIALDEHNQKVEAADLVVAETERDLAERKPDDSPPSRSYEALRAQAWGVLVAGQLTAAVSLDGPGRLDTAGVNRQIRLAAERALPSLDDDPALLLRSIYYLIKLLGLSPEWNDSLVAVKAGLWREYEVVSAALWDGLASRSDSLSSADQLAGAERLGSAAVEGAAPALAAAVRASRGRLRDLLGETEIVLGGDGAVRDGRRPLPVASVRLRAVLDRFEARDEVLIAAEVYGGLLTRDRVRHAQISPVTARNIGVAPADKLAGTTLGHFGGFLDRGWRENDLMWGRLDAAEILIRALGRGQPPREDLVSLAQQEIVAEENPDLAGPDWKRRLGERARGDVSDGELNGRRLVSMGLRVAAIVRGMLQAAAEADSGGGLVVRARAFALRSVANVLGFGLALLYLPATAFFTKGKLLRRVAIGAALLPSLWGLATLVLGILGVLTFTDVVGPAAIGIAIYPLFLLLYWLIWLLARYLERCFQRMRRKFRERREPHGG